MGPARGFHPGQGSGSRGSALEERLGEGAGQTERLGGEATGPEGGSEEECAGRGGGNGIEKKKPEGGRSEVLVTRSHAPCKAAVTGCCWRPRGLSVTFTGWVSEHCACIAWPGKRSLTSGFRDVNRGAIYVH